MLSSGTRSTVQPSPVLRPATFSSFLQGPPLSTPFQKVDPSASQPDLLGAKETRPEEFQETGQDRPEQPSGTDQLWPSRSSDAVDLGDNLRLKPLEKTYESSLVEHPMHPNSDRFSSRYRTAGSPGSSGYSISPSPSSPTQMHPGPFSASNPFAPTMRNELPNENGHKPQYRLAGSHRRASESLGPPFGATHMDGYYGRYDPSFPTRGSVSGEYTASPGLMESTRRPTFREDPKEVLSRFSSAIPDLHHILSNYEENDRRAAEVEAMKKNDVRRADELRRKDTHIDTLSKQNDNLVKHNEAAEKQHEAEVNKFRLHIGNLEEKEKEHKDRIMEADVIKREWENVQSRLEEQQIVIERDRFEMERSLVEEKDRLNAEFDRWKADVKREFDLSRQDLETSHHRALQEQTNAFDRRLSSEIESMRVDFERQRSDLSANFNQERAEIERRLSVTQQELQSCINDGQRNQDALDMQRADLMREWEHERQELMDGWNEERAHLERQRVDSLEEQQGKWTSLHSSMQENFDSEKSRMLEDHQRLKDGWDQDQASFQRHIADLKGIAEGLGEEKKRLQNVIEGFGEAMDLKSKGDAY